MLESKVMDLTEYTIAGGEKLPLLSFKTFDATGLVGHCFTTKLGGVSEGEFTSLNLSFTRGDDHGRVMENFSRVACALGVKVSDIVISDQTHTTNVRLVTRDDCGAGIVKDRDFSDIDGLITNEPGVVLSTFYADCVPLYILDINNKAIGLSHSGWRGTVGRMGRATLEAMKSAFGTNPEDVIVAIGPSICQDCYEISRDVAEEFMKEFPEHVEELLVDKGNDKFQLDLWQANRVVFQEAGVPLENITVTDICTCCNSDVLFSHRASRGRRGNLGAFMYLK